jgi:hypothetical protein
VAEIKGDLEVRLKQAEDLFPDISAVAATLAGLT